MHVIYPKHLLQTCHGMERKRRKVTPVTLNAFHSFQHGCCGCSRRKLTSLLFLYIWQFFKITVHSREVSRG